MVRADHARQRRVIQAQRDSRRLVFEAKKLADDFVADFCAEKPAVERSVVPRKPYRARLRAITEYVAANSERLA
jgi:hypothetical protein